MDKSQTWVPVAKVKDAHGIRGELYLRFRSKESDWVEGRQEMRLVGPNREVRQLKISKLRIHKEGAVIQVEGLTTRNSAEELKGYFWEIPSTELVSKPGEGIYLKEVEGFEVIDSKLGSVGRIVGFYDNGAQDILEVRGESATYDIPFVDAFIDKIEAQQGRVLMTLPEGLIE